MIFGGVETEVGGEIPPFPGFCMKPCACMFMEANTQY